MEKGIVFHCPTPDCEHCIHHDCPRYRDEVEMCGFLLKYGYPFSKMIEKELEAKLNRGINR